jgi:threonine dehydrogenase-like Zn-dependent dehydrogenase
MCEHGEDLGFTKDGGTAQYVVVHERQCHSLNAVRDRVGADHAFDIGAVVEPTSIAFNGMFLRAGGFRPGDHVAVFGCGPVGLACVALARACGAGRVVAVDTQSPRRELAESMGADVTIDPSDGLDVGPRLLDITDGAGIAMAIEATGAMGKTVRAIEESLAFGAKVVLIGMETDRVAVDTVALQMKGAQIYAALGHLGGGFAAVIELHRAGRMDMSAIVTARFGLDEGITAIDRLGERRDAKILLYPNGKVGAL